jgi:hypothetical protein
MEMKVQIEKQWRFYEPGQFADVDPAIADILIRRGFAKEAQKDVPWKEYKKKKA